MSTDTCPPYAPFFGFAGVTASMVLSGMPSIRRFPSSLTMVAVGAAYGTAKAGATIAAAGVLGPHIIMTALLPVIMAGILAIYGLVVSVFISTSRTANVGHVIRNIFRCSRSHDRLSAIHVRRSCKWDILHLIC